MGGCQRCKLSRPIPSALYAQGRRCSFRINLFQLNMDVASSENFLRDHCLSRRCLRTMTFLRSNTPFVYEQCVVAVLPWIVAR